MKRTGLGGVTVVLFAAALTCFSAYSATTITASPGPYGGTRVATPWGQFLVVQQGSSIWIGTEAEYVHLHATNVMRQDGLVEFKMSGAPESAHYFVSKDKPSTSVGSKALADIDVIVAFDLEADKKMGRPKKPDSAEYVAIVWLQSGAGNTSASIYDSRLSKTYRPFTCWVADGNLHQCQFIVSKDSLANAATVFFTVDGTKPGAIALKSVAQTAYSGILIGMRQMQEKTPREADRQTILKLHALDPAVPEFIDSAPK